MLVMIAMIISFALPGSSAGELAQAASNHEPVAIKTSYLNPQRPTPTPRNDSLTLATSSEKRTKLDGQMISAKSNSSFASEHRSTIDLSLLGENRHQKQDKMSKHQLNRHQYSVSLTNQTHWDGNSTLRVDSIGLNLNATGADLETSDSRYRPKVRSRSDEVDEYEPVGTGADDTDSSSIDDESYIDGASSNRREKKVMRELTKILSKGMSGATDNMRVETLENLKKRQKERKALKESRAKLFEDLLTTAINSHSEKLKKSRRHNQHKDSASNLKSSASSLDLPHNSNLEPELATDAETVLQHLQGLATAIDGDHLPSSGGQFAPSSNLEPGDASNEAESEDATSPTESSDTGDPVLSADERPRKTKTPLTASDRPIVRQFKKIKNQISQRRKQLDQIRKLFNAELILNPKDGSLISKQISSSGKKIRQLQQPNSSGSDDLIDYSQDSEAPPSNKRSRGGGRVNGYKARELLIYLRANPEILASVMSELTVDADPTENNRASPPVGGREEGSYSSSGAPIDYNDLNIESLSTRKAVYRSPSRPVQSANSDTDQPPWHQAPLVLNARSSGRRTHSGRLAQDFEPMGRPSRLWPRGFGNQASGSSFAQPIRARSAESLLLESLRERQLLNLARLDLVLAERQAASHNRSSALTQPNSSYSQQPILAKPHNRSDHSEAHQRSGRDDELEASKRNQTSASSKSGGSRSPEEEHHFMVVNPNSNDSSSGRPGSDFLNQLQPNQLQEQPSHNMRSLNMPGSQTMNYNMQQQQQQQQYSPSGMNANQNGHLNRVNNELQSSNTLKRFRDWRDVSQSEASSWQYDKTNTPDTNVTWTPYDLTTGGSSSLTMEAQSSRAPSTMLMNYRSQPAASSRSGNFTLPPINPPQMQLGSLNSLNSINSLGSISATGPTLSQNQLLTNMMGQQLQYINGDKNLASSIFMTRSSVTGEPDLSTVKVGGGSTSDDANKTPASSVPAEEGSIKREDGESDEIGQPQVESGDGSSAARSSHVNYFSAYKQEMPARGRKRPRQSRNERKPGANKTGQRHGSSHRDEPISDEGPETDDMGAMWA